MENEKISNLRFKLFLESKNVSVDEYLQDRTKGKNTEYMEFIDNYIASYHKIPGNEEPVESNPEEFDDYLKFKVLDEKLQEIASKEENIGIKDLGNCKEAKELLEKYGLTKENDKAKLYPRLEDSFKFGVQKRITQNYRRELFAILPEEYQEKYFKALSYENELEEGKYTDMQRRLRIAENIDKIEANQKQIKFFVYFSETGKFKENEVLTLKEMTEKYNLAKEKVIEENQENEYLKDTYRKVSLVLIVDDVERINIINLENYLTVPSYENFEEYINENFSEQFIQDYITPELIEIERNKEIKEIEKKWQQINNLDEKVNISESINQSAFILDGIDMRNELKNEDEPLEKYPDWATKENIELIEKWSSLMKRKSNVEDLNKPEEVDEESEEDEL